LAELIPDFAKTLPHDLIGGQPMIYRREDAGNFVLYSVGWNERDDGGQITLNDGGSMAPNSPDWVWQIPAM